MLEVVEFGSKRILKYFLPGLSCCRTCLGICSTFLLVMLALCCFINFASIYWHPHFAAITVDPTTRANCANVGVGEMIRVAAGASVYSEPRHSIHKGSLHIYIYIYLKIDRFFIFLNYTYFYFFYIYLFCVYWYIFTFIHLDIYIYTYVFNIYIYI